MDSDALWTPITHWTTIGLWTTHLASGRHFVFSDVFRGKSTTFKETPRSQKQIKGPRTLDRAYIEQEKARIAAAEALEIEKAANREARKIAKELKAEEAKKQPKVIKVKSKGTKSVRKPGSAKIARSRVTRRLKYDAEGADIRRLEVGVSFLSLCGMYFR